MEASESFSRAITAVTSSESSSLQQCALFVTRIFARIALETIEHPASSRCVYGFIVESTDQPAGERNCKYYMWSSFIVWYTLFKMSPRASERQNARANTKKTMGSWQIFPPFSGTRTSFTASLSNRWSRKFYRLNACTQPGLAKITKFTNHKKTLFCCHILIAV